MRGKVRLAAAAIGVLGLAGCSSVPNAVNPISWYRDVAGLSKNDKLDQGQNAQNLAQGSKEPYPNLGTVPGTPDKAMSSIDRAKLADSLIAAREHAYITTGTGGDLRAGTTSSIAVPPPAPAPKTAAGSKTEPAATVKAKPAQAAPKTAGTATVPTAPTEKMAASSAPEPSAAGATPKAMPAVPVTPEALSPPQQENAPKKEGAPEARAGLTKRPADKTAGAAEAPKGNASASPPAPPMESPLTSPTIPNLPKGEPVPPAPPMPHIPAPPGAASRAPAAVHPRAASGAVAATPASSATAPAPQPIASDQVAKITFAAGSAAISEKERQAVAAVAKLHKKNGGMIRIVGHGEASGRNAAINGLTLALERARAIAMLLTGQGVPAKEISVDAAPVSASGGKDVPHAEIYLEN